MTVAVHTGPAGSQLHSFDCALSAATIEALAEEARHQRLHALHVEDSINRVDARGGLRTRRRMHVADPGHQLASLHDGLGTSLANEFGAGKYFPTRSSYIYYDVGDFIGPHHDIQQCQVTLLAALTPDKTLDIYLDGVEGPPDSVFERFLADALSARATVAMPLGTVLALRGESLVHAYRPTTSSAVTAVMCYAGLKAAH